MIFSFQPLAIICQWQSHICSILFDDIITKHNKINAKKKTKKSFASFLILRESDL